MADKDGEEVSQLGGTKGGLHNLALSLVIINVNHAECRPEEHLEQISGMLLTGERLVRVNVLHCLGVRNHKILFLRNQVKSRSVTVETYVLRGGHEF